MSRDEMTPNEMTDAERFEQVLESMREETVSAETAAAARERVWVKLSAPGVALCAEFRSELRGYLAGHLLESRRLLVEDHLSRCQACRRELRELKGEGDVVEMPSLRRRFAWAPWVWRAVAAGIAVLALYASRDRIDAALAPSGPRATVVSVRGDLYAVGKGALQAGAALGEGDAVRTGPAARAFLRLRDGSAVEMNERSELYVTAAWSGQAIHLERGDVIVEAAVQRRGRLRVLTRDATASVQGTVFGVSAGTEGSLVSVVEGSVRVDSRGADRILKPGETASSSSLVKKGTVRDAVAWSENAQKYYGLLAELVNIEPQIAAMINGPLRTEARLLPYLPANTLVYGAIPNVGNAIQQAQFLIERRGQDSEIVREWWTSAQAQELKRALDSLQAVAPLLGNEIVFCLVGQTADIRRHVPLILAEVKPGARATLASTLDKLFQTAGVRASYQATDKLLLVADSPANLALLQSQLGRGAGSTFASEIAARYRRGAGWLAAVNVEAILSAAPGLTPDRVLTDVAGAGQTRHLFIEQRYDQGVDGNEASLTFKGARQGLAAWLAAPAPAGSAEYVSSEAILAISAATRDARQTYDEMLNALTRVAHGIAGELRQFETETGVNVANDFASSLGTDLTLAIENASIPMPGWTLAVEALRPAALDAAMQRLTDAFNRRTKESQIVLRTEMVNGREWHSIKSSSNQITIHWTYDRGYVIVSADRAVATRAIATRASGFPLVRSMRFLQQLPVSSGVHHSGFFWLNTRGALQNLLVGLAPGPLQKLLETRDPVLVVVDGETERIHASTRTRISSLLLDLMLALPAQARENAIRN